MTHSAMADGWRLVWADEFDKPGLPDSSKWDYEVGFIRNNELQYYTKARLENTRIEDGKLIIECRKERFPNAKYKPGSTDWRHKDEFTRYTAASLVTRGKAAWQYGRIEVRAKLPRGKGVWPAIWMLGEDRKHVGWPRSGEIDIMEFVGKQPDKIHGTLHWGDPADGKHKQSGGALTVAAPWENFHIYAVEWFADRIDFYYDDVKYRSVKLDEAGEGEGNPFRKPQYLLMNFAWGGAWGGEVDESVLPQRFEIDYVRVYEQVKR